MWLKYLLILMLCFLVKTPVAGAIWELKTDLRSAMDTQSIDMAVANNWKALEGSEAFSVPDIHTQVDGVPVSVTGIVGRVYYRIGTPVRSDSSLIWDSRSESMRVELSIGRVHAFKIERRTFNGGFIDLRVEGNCDNVMLSIPEDAGSMVTSQVVATMQSGNLQLRNRNAVIDWPSDAWQVDRLSCSGVEGFGEQVKQYALQILEVPTAEVQEGLESAIQSRLNEWAAKAVNIAMTPQLILPDRDDVVLKTEPGNLGEMDSGQILVNGQVRLQLPDVAKGDTHLVQQKFEDPRAGLSGASETQIPVQAVRSLLMAGYFANAFATDFNSRQFKPFNDLMQDRQAQGYVFPDLTRFSKKTKFEFAANVMAAPTMRNIRNADQDGVILADTTIPLIVLMQAPRDDVQKYVPYVQFRGNIRGTAMMRIVDGQMAVQMRDAQVTLKSGWNQEYVRKYKPKTKIRDEIFADALAESIREEVHLIDLPFWKMSQTAFLTPVEMAVDGERLRVYWEAKEVPAQGNANSLASNSSPDSRRSISTSSKASKSKSVAKNSSVKRSIASVPESIKPQPLSDRAKERIFDGVRSDVEGQQLQMGAQASGGAAGPRQGTWLWGER